MRFGDRQGSRRLYGSNGAFLKDHLAPTQIEGTISNVFNELEMLRL
jgi:hypothetical protein